MQSEDYALELTIAKFLTYQALGLCGTKHMLAIDMAGFYQFG